MMVTLWSNVSDANTGIWWYCDDANITEIGDSPEGVYTRESRKLTKKRKIMSVSKDIIFVPYIRTKHLVASGSVFFKNSLTCPKIII